MAATQPAATPQSPRGIVVCGGGVIGSCTAYFLCKNKSSRTTTITLVEKSSVACAASGKAGGFLALDWSDGSPLSSLSRASFALHRSLSQLLDGPTAYGYRPLHTLSLSFPNSHPNKSTSPLAIPSWIDGPAGSPRTIGTPDTTGQVHPKLFTQTLIENSDDLNIVIGEIKKVEVSDGKVVGIVLVEEDKFIPADEVVLALGPWSAQLPLISSLFSVSGLKAHSIILRPTEPESITPHALFLSYRDSPGARTLDPEVYPRTTGEVYVCGMSAEMEVPDDPEGIVGDPDSIEMLHRIAGTVSSRLRRDGGAEVMAEQTCFLQMTGCQSLGRCLGLRGATLRRGIVAGAYLMGRPPELRWRSSFLKGSQVRLILHHWLLPGFWGH